MPLLLIQVSKSEVHSLSLNSWVDPDPARRSSTWSKDAPAPPRSIDRIASQPKSCDTPDSATPGSPRLTKRGPLVSQMRRRPLPTVGSPHPSGSKDNALAT
jgi:hypothetical protein